MKDSNRPEGEEREDQTHDAVEQARHHQRRLRCVGIKLDIATTEIERQRDSQQMPVLMEIYPETSGDGFQCGV
jgi:hypothetical protein